MIRASCNSNVDYSLEQSSMCFLLLYSPIIGDLEFELLTIVN